MVPTVAASKDVLSFGPFRLAPGERLLTREGAPIELGARALDILIALVSRHNEVIGKKELLSHVWPDVTVGEASLRVHMASVRKALGDGKDGARYITTLAGRGYCFVAPVTRSRDDVEAATSLIEGQTLAQQQRRLAAILAADVVGYSRLMATDESGTLVQLTKLRTDVIEPKIAQFHGRIVGAAGDSLLVEFASAINAVQCAVDAQEGLSRQNADLPEDRRMVFRMGINVGDVIAEAETIHGDGVNIASRLEKLAEPGGVCIGRNVYDQVKGKLACTYTDLGEQRLHNIPEPVRVYRVKPSRLGATAPTGLLARDVPTLSDKPSIAVLPFANLSGDSEQEYFADG